MPRLALLVAAALAAPAALAPVAAARAADPAPPAGAPFEMEPYQLVLLLRAPTWKKLPEAEANALQERHLAHLGRLAAAGKALVCGPFDGQLDPAYRGACLYSVKTPEEARSLASEDPAVQAGQLRVEVMTWWVGKGWMAFPKAPAAAPR